MLHSSGWLFDAAVSIRRRKKLIQHGEERHQGAETKSFGPKGEKFLAEFIHPLVFKRGVVLLSVAAGRLTAADVPRKDEQAPTRHAGATATGGRQ